MNDKTLLSFVIPCYRSENTIQKVISEINEVVMQRKEEYDYEVICVNDDSPDNVYSVLKDIAASNNKVKVINLAKNQGKHSAVLAGLAYIKGDYAVLIDDDYQSPTYNLWRLMVYFPAIDPDVVMAEYTEKKESLWKRCGSKVNAKIGNWLLDKPKDLNMSNFIVMKRFVADEIIKYTNPYPFIEGLIFRVTKNVETVKMEERNRADDKSTGYTLAKSISLFFNGFTAFSVKPLRLSTFIGAGTSIVGFIYALVVLMKKLAGKVVVQGFATSVILQLIIGGMMLMSLGLIGEYVGRIYICLNKAPQYIVKETINI